MLTFSVERAQKYLFHLATLSTQLVCAMKQTLHRYVVATGLLTSLHVMPAVNSSQRSTEWRTFWSAHASQVILKLPEHMREDRLRWSSFLEHQQKPVAHSGLCDNGRCNTKLHIFIAVFAFTVFIHSTSEVGGMLIIMRCTHPKDKAMAMGIIQFSIGLLSNIPCPNIYARIIDATCIVWTKMCGENGHCSLYDSDSFRTYFFGKLKLEKLLKHECF